MPDPDPPPIDPSFDEERLAEVVDDIDARGKRECDVLLTDLLRVCWPTTAVQNQ
jgi:hypothetical protein